MMKYRELRINATPSDASQYPARIEAALRTEYLCLYLGFYSAQHDSQSLAAGKLEYCHSGMKPEN